MCVGGGGGGGRRGWNGGHSVGVGVMRKGGEHLGISVSVWEGRGM